MSMLSIFLSFTVTQLQTKLGCLPLSGTLQVLSSREGSSPYPQILDRAIKACLEQAL